MFGNETLTSLSEQEKRNIMIYVAEGAILSAFNLPIAIIILLSALRKQKEYVIIVGMVATDFVLGVAFILAGLFRIVKGLHRKGEMWDQWECASTVPNIVAVFITPQIGLMALIISVDRLLSVSIPFRYSKFSALYAWSLIGGSVFISVLVSIISLYYVYSQKVQPQVSSYCIVTESFGAVVYRKVIAARIIITFASIILYFPIIYMMRQVLNVSCCAILNAHQRQKLRRITITACLVAINTLFLFNLPDLIIFLNPGGINRTASICYILLLNRGVLNIFIYTIRHRELRHAVISLISTHTIAHSGSIVGYSGIHQIRNSLTRKGSKTFINKR